MTTTADGNAPRYPGMLIIGSGPSGAGKNSVFDEVLKLQQGKLVESVSCTTRERRQGEVEGREYYFVTLEQFEKLEKEGHFLESEGGHDGRRYGTPIGPVLDKLQQGIDVLLVIEVNGAKVARKRMPDALTIFIMPAGETLEQKFAQLQMQLAKRGRDPVELLQERLELAESEIDQSKEYQHVAVNAPGKLDDAVANVNQIIEQARKLRNRT